MSTPTRKEPLSPKAREFKLLNRGLSLWGKKSGTKRLESELDVYFKKLRRKQ